ncbi:MAG: response regulator transcription factor [Anaerolineales bacterium]|jgi:two-component system KDP operon response regulator KdpE|nr:response regulator transcription factor [Anaerolineales bacterium]
MLELLIIDDDENLTELLKTFFSTQGYSISVAANGSIGLRALYARSPDPDLVLLDVTMPQRNGWETLERIREVSDVPVIMLTARSEEPDILRGFSRGADDYVTKPFSFAQLAARIQAVLSRTGRQAADAQTQIQKGDLTVNLRTRQVWRGSQNISLTPTEFKLLTTLMSRSGEVLSADELVREVWGPQYAGEVGNVRRYIWHLRQKIEPDPDNPQYLHNEHGFGYRFEAP